MTLFQSTSSMYYFQQFYINKSKISIRSNQNQKNLKLMQLQLKWIWSLQNIDGNIWTLEWKITKEKKKLEQSLLKQKMRTSTATLFELRNVDK